MSYPDYLWLLLGMGLVTYLPRMFPLLLLADRPLPQGVRDWLALIPPAVLAALIAPPLLINAPTQTLTIAKPELLAAIPTLLFAWKTRSLGGAVALGMAAFWLFGLWR
jgi:branched-subunit amino acid transport protein